MKQLRKILAITICLIIIFSSNTLVKASEITDNLENIEDESEEILSEENAEIEDASFIEEITETEDIEELDETTQVEETEDIDIISSDESTDEEIKEVDEINEEVETEEIAKEILLAYQINLIDDTNYDILDSTIIDGPNKINLGDTLEFTITLPSLFYLDSTNINNIEYNYTSFDEETNKYLFVIDDTSNFIQESIININVYSAKLDEDNSIMVMSNYSGEVNTFYFDSSGTPITIDGYYDDWSDKPYSWHYNWDNSDNCWYWGNWYNGSCYKTPEGTYDNDVRHLIQMYTDGEYIYIRIKIATIYESQFNGEDYIITFNNNEKAAFQITDTNGQSITNNVNRFTPGIHPIQVRHRDGACSFNIVDGASGYLTVYEDFHNTDLEFKVPIEACKYQNNNIDINNIEVIKFFTPNLMYQSIETHGTPTYPIILIIILVIICVFAEIKYLNNKKKKVG